MIINEQYAKSIRLAHVGNGANWTGIKRDRMTWLYPSAEFNHARYKHKWVGRCECGNLYLGYPLTAKSCGCLKTEKSAQYKREHRRLTKEQVFEILRDRSHGSAKRHALTFGISHAGVTAIRAGSTYKDWFDEFNSKQTDLDKYLPVYEELALVKKKLRNAQAELSRLRAFKRQFNE